MNITLRCQGSKREQARPPICAAGRRAHRRAGCRGDQSRAALNAPVRPNRQHRIDPRILFLSTPTRPAPHHLVAPPALLPQCHEHAVERALLVEWSTRSSGSRARSGRSRALSQPMSPAPRLVCCRTLARHRHWTSSRSRISAARSAHLASVSRLGNRVASEIVPAADISSQGRFRFRSGHCGDRNGCRREPAVLFLPANTARLLLVFLLVLATIDYKNLCNR
jgi:hypothetical protein